ncbi:MAG TPA: ABC transporter permease [Actinophytocola sp.]|jgi:ABC-2 type transport system permease protein|uniref:ABC transporter permease n=1 Tax=Actinophytocola sp. TaxID=1872138 RepID=UPI002E0C5FB5|nr:ABC transporter permease [Actinophytocola sp.]
MTSVRTPVAAVRVPARSAGGELRAIKIVWQRELIRFADDRMRLVTSLVQPFAFLFILGSGLSSLTSASTGGVDLRTFMYPGILAMSVLFTAIFSAASIVWDREFGFLREMLVAPVRRSSIIIGKCLGGTTVAALQGVLVVAIAGLVGVPYTPTLIITVLGLQALLAFTLTAFGLMIAVRITQLQAFMAVTQLFVMPLFFICGAIFPVSGLPGWLAVLNRIDPLTYAVDPMRHAVFEHLDVNEVARRALDAGVTWGGWRVPALLEAAIVLAIGLVMLGVAVVEFNRTE